MAVKKVNDDKGTTAWLKDEIWRQLGSYLTGNNKNAFDNQKDFASSFFQNRLVLTVVRRLRLQIQQCSLMR